MGVPMGTPFFKVKHLVDAGKLEVRSSNYTLYGDLSARVMSLLAEVAPKLEVYSIDEAFMNMDGIDAAGLPSICSDLIVKIRRWTGIPVSIGIAETKTLGKVANHFAKKYKGYHGVCMIDTPEKMHKALSLTPIGDVWGIGWRGAPKLEAAGIKTALDFVNQPDLAPTFVVCCCAMNIPFHFTGLATLKIKETDRIAALKNEMRKTGYVIQDMNDSELLWDGERCEASWEPIDTYEDHRMALAFAPMCFLHEGLRINNPQVVTKSYPRFWEDLQQAGFQVLTDM